MIEAGVPKEKLGLINGGFQIVQILTPLLIGRFLNLGKPLDIFLQTYPIRYVKVITACKATLRSHLVLLLFSCFLVFKNGIDHSTWHLGVFHAIVQDA
jgi:hypothetical protein